MMLNIYKYNNLINFSADVFMCEKQQSSNGLNCWNLRLLVHGQLIDAYHWHPISNDTINYKEKDTVLVVGNWATKHKVRFQIIRSEVISYLPANDDIFYKDDSRTLKNNLQSTFDAKREDS